MCDPTVLLIGGTLLTAYTQYSGAQDQAKAIEAEGRNNAAIAEYNAKVSDVNSEIQRRGAHDALQRGADNAGDIRERVRQANATGRATMAGKGLLTDTGTNLDLLSQNAGVGEINARTAMNNAEREAYGYKIGQTDALAESQNLRLQGEAALKNSQFSAKTTRRAGLLSAAGTIASGAASYGLSQMKSPETIRWNSARRV